MFIFLWMKLLRNPGRVRRQRDVIVWKMNEWVEIGGRTEKIWVGSVNKRETPLWQIRVNICREFVETCSDTYVRRGRIKQV